MIRRLTVLAACGVALATAAQAQAPHPPPGGDMAARHAAMQKQRMEDLKVVLRLRPDQEPALAAFMEAQGPHRMERRMMEPKARTTPERLDAMAKHDAEMQARHARMRQALATFYAALSPDQQKVFDALHRLQGPGPMMMHGGPDGPHGGRTMMIRRHGGPGDEPAH